MADELKAALLQLGDEAPLAINPLIYAEISVGFERIEDLERAAPRARKSNSALPNRKRNMATSISEGPAIAALNEAG